VNSKIINVKRNSQRNLFSFHVYHHKKNFLFNFNWSRLSVLTSHIECIPIQNVIAVPIGNWTSWSGMRVAYPTHWMFKKIESLGRSRSEESHKNRNSSIGMAIVWCLAHIAADVRFLPISRNFMSHVFVTCVFLSCVLSVYFFRFAFTHAALWAI